MKWTQSLIRIADHEIDTLRKRVAEINARRAACEMRLESLEQEAEAESAHARAHAESGWYLVGFREGWKLRKDKVQGELLGIQIEEQGARDALNRAYEELKKVEQVAETARVAAVKVENARETAQLDELALQRAVRGR